MGLLGLMVVFAVVGLAVVGAAQFIGSRKRRAMKEQLRAMPLVDLQRLAASSETPKLEFKVSSQSMHGTAVEALFETLLSRSFESTDSFEKDHDLLTSEWTKRLQGLNDWFEVSCNSVEWSNQSVAGTAAKLGNGSQLLPSTFHWLKKMVDEHEALLTNSGKAGTVPSWANTVFVCESKSHHSGVSVQQWVEVPINTPFLLQAEIQRLGVSQVR